MPHQSCRSSLYLLQVSPLRSSWAGLWAKLSSLLCLLLLQDVVAEKDQVLKTKTVPLTKKMKLPGALKVLFKRIDFSCRFGGAFPGNFEHTPLLVVISSP